MRGSRERVRGGSSLAIGLAIIAAVAAVMRFWNLDSGLPKLATSDEMTVVSRANGIMHGHLPTLYDWPSGSMMILAGALRVLGWFSPEFLVNGSADQYLVARIISASSGVALTVLAGLIAYECARPRPTARYAAWTAATLIALAYTATRMSRISHPEVEQAALATASLLATLYFVRFRRNWLVVVAGVLAGAAAGTKYIGGAAVVPALVAVFVVHRPSVRAAAIAAATIVAGLVGFVVLVPAALFDHANLWAGVKGQFLHQADGHLGYDSTSPALGFHLSQSIPGSWGWPLAVVAFIAVITAAVRGAGGTRLVALYAVITIGVLGSSHVLFPHYILVALPALGCVASVELWRYAPDRRLVPIVLAALVLIALVPTGLDDVRLLRTSADVSTQTEAASLVTTLPGKVIKESYTDDSGIGQTVSAVGLDPGVLSCHCYVELSSYMESRYRLEPVRYAREVAVYNAVRATGRVVATISPSRTLSYKWDLLPQNGMNSLPIFGSAAVGPQITIISLP